VRATSCCVGHMQYIHCLWTCFGSRTDSDSVSRDSLDLGKPAVAVRAVEPPPSPEAASAAVHSWSQASVGKWLARLGITSAVRARFRARGVTGTILLWLAPDEFTYVVACFSPLLRWWVTCATARTVSIRTNACFVRFSGST
jgi:hypothetical protein